MELDDEDYRIDYEEDSGGNGRAVGLTMLFVIVVVIAVIVAMLSGCTTTKYIPQETVKVEYRDREVEKIVADTVRDTRIVWVKGDTIVDVREKEKVKRVEIHDTCYIERIDSVRVPYPVEKNLTTWEKVKMDFGGIAMGGVTIALCAAVIWLIKKFRA